MSGSDHSSAPDQQGASAERPPAIPGHQLLRRIARGSYGEIWLARTELGALRAVKIIRRASFADARPYDREFAGIQRYEPISREHEGLVDVLQVGREEAAGFFYYVMELADDAAGSAVNPKAESRNQKAECAAEPPSGNRQMAVGNWHSYTPLTLAQVIHQRQRLPVSEVVEIGIQLAQALEFLHSRRLVHRDVKPSNIIFVGGQPKLADVGLIADLGNPQSFVGTEGYIPPEGPGSAQADIYSLGKVLYEAATGKDRQQFPDLPTRLGDGQDDPALAELNEVLLKACESKPRARYSSAAEMAADLERLKAGQSLRARRARHRRRRTIAAGVAVIAGLILVGMGVVAVIQFSHSLPRPRLYDHLGGQFSKSRFLLRHDFNGLQLDTNLWTRGHAAFGPGDGRRSFRAEQSGGELVLSANTEYAIDSVCQSVWVDLQRDLRPLAPCRIEIELAGKSGRGGFVVAISNTNAPPHDFDSSGTNLVEFDSMALDEPLTLPATRLWIDLLPPGEAVVYRDTRRLDKFDVKDLNALPAWQLRLFCFAGTSMKHPPGNADFRIRHVLISNKPKGKMKSEIGDAVDVISYGDLGASSIGFRGGILTLLVQESNTACRLVPIDPAAHQVAPVIPGGLKLDFQSGPPISDFVECGSRLVGIRNWPGVLFDLNSAPPSPLGELTNSLGGHTIYWPTGATFDGRSLWFLESDQSTNQHFGLCALDLERRAVTKFLRSTEKYPQGLAWDGRFFWISYGKGQVCAIDLPVAMRRGTVEAGTVRNFRGKYTRLAFGQGYVWGLEPDKRRICKIKITD